MTKSIKLNLYSEFNLTIIDPCKILAFLILLADIK